MGVIQQLLLSQKIAGGGGGGSFTVTSIHQQTSSDSFGTGAFTTTSFTPNSSRRLIVIAHAQSQSNDALDGSSLTISDNDSGITSWTAIVNTTTHSGWGYGSRAWVSDQNASGSSMTVSIDAGTFAIENYRVEVFAVENFSSIGATASGSSTTFISPQSITLSAAPASASVCLAAANVALGGGTSTIDPGTGWTEVTGSDVTRTDWWNFQAQTRTGSTSTTVEWQDLATGASPIGAALLAFEIVGT